jgi:hypothetical protein
MINYPEQNPIGQEPGKKKKEPKGILKDLMELERVDPDYNGDPILCEKGKYVEWSDIEAIIKKYS